MINSRIRRRRRRRRRRRKRERKRKKRVLSSRILALITTIFQWNTHSYLSEFWKRSGCTLIMKKNSSWFQSFAVFWMLYAFFRVIPRRLNFICRRFGALCLFHLHRQVSAKNELGLRKVRVLIRAKLFPYKYPTFLKPSSFFTSTCLWRWNRQIIPKRRHIKFRRRGITHTTRKVLAFSFTIWYLVVTFHCPSLSYGKC